MSNGTSSDSAAYGRTMPPALRIDASSSSGKNGSYQQPRADAAQLAIDPTALDTDSTKTLDPLEYYHRHMLDSHPGMDSSVASDDDLLDLLRNTKDRRALKWIEECGLPLSAQLVPVNYPPWKGRLGEFNASVHSFDSPTVNTAHSSSENSPEDYWRSPDTDDSPSSGGGHRTGSSLLHFDHRQASSVTTLPSSRGSDSSCPGSSILTHSQQSSRGSDGDSH